MRRKEPRVLDEAMKTIEERKQEAKAFRKTTSRRDLGLWTVETNRPIVKELITDQEKTRIWELIPIRRQRMAASPFAFFRGAAVIQAHDLSMMPGTSFRVQACGDAHMGNFGIFSSPERRLIFDMNDFDETLPAPFEVDIKRLAASIEICGRDRKFTAEQRETAVSEAAAIYRNTMLECSDMGNMEVWYRHLDVEEQLHEKENELSSKEKNRILSMLDKALSKNNERAMEKMTEIADGKLRIKSSPPLIVPLREMMPDEKKREDFQHKIMKSFEIYKDTLPKERRILIDQYEPVELAHKVVGIGSVGRRAWILVMMGRENGDPLVLQIKQAEKSVLEPYYGASTFKECGQRVVSGQRAIQTAGDILLGWTHGGLPGEEKDHYYIRQLWDAKGTANLTKITEEEYYFLSLMCAGTMAQAHAKTGDRHAIAGYLGKGKAFEKAMVRYAAAYADQNEADYETFLKFSRDML